MFTAGEIDKVMEQAGYSDHEVITRYHVPMVVGHAHDCGVLDPNVNVWTVEDDNETGVLITYDFGEKLRLSSRWKNTRDLLRHDDSPRDAVLRILAFVGEASVDLKRAYTDFALPELAARRRSDS